MAPVGVAAGRVRSPQRFLREFRDPGRQAEADEVEQGEGGEGLAVAVGAVFGDGELGGVTEELVDDVGGVSVGGDDDLDPEGGVLVRDVGVGSDALVDEVPGQ